MPSALRDAPPDDLTVAYIVESQPLFEDLRQVAAQLAGLLVLAATGLYGVLSGSVTERTREIGVRAALGASRADILGLVVRQGMTLTGVGVAIGLPAAFALTQRVAQVVWTPVAGRWSDRSASWAFVRLLSRFRIGFGG